eukprot:15365800-Ditylum_brightwellii.AAC.1
MSDIDAITNHFQQLIQSSRDKDPDHDIIWPQYNLDPLHFQLKQADLHPQVMKITPIYNDSKGIIHCSIPESLSSEVYSLQPTSPTVQIDPGGILQSLAHVTKGEPFSYTSSSLGCKMVSLALIKTRLHRQLDLPHEKHVEKKVPHNVIQ